MRIFVSWSGLQSLELALGLKKWLPDVIQSLEPWMSRADIGAGATWTTEINNALGESRFGIVCLTRQNLSEPWLHFEAGAVAKATTEKTRVCPYLLDLEAPEIPQGNPLSQFQAKQANKDDTYQVLVEINRALGEKALSTDALSRQFERAWPELDGIITKARAQTSPTPPARTAEEMIPDILTEVRAIAQRLDEQRGQDKPVDSPSYWYLNRALRDRSFTQSVADYLSSVIPYLSLTAYDVTVNSQDDFMRAALAELTSEGVLRSRFQLKREDAPVVWRIHSTLGEDALRQSLETKGISVTSIRVVAGGS